MKVLLVEDDRETAEFVGSGLGQDGHVVEIVGDCGEGLMLAASKTHDLLIVDRRLPDMDGLSLVRSFRAQGGTAPVIFLTTMSGIDDRVEGFEAGGDDYLIKPFAFSELRARVQALARRPPLTQTETVLRVGDMEMDLIRRRVTRGGQDIELQPLEFRILEYLLRNKGRVVTRNMLLDRVWDFHFDPNTKVVEANISRLRTKIDRPFAQPLLHTIRGSGYILEDAGGAKC
ncbi:MAG TPA: response regulator transcription factor [Hyphomicrobiales bacterium]|nr:response regulator transcription factor [Hyphomicrobiales bacterium]